MTNIASNFKNNTNPLVSVVLPVYNGEKYLKAAIDSVLAQSLVNFELIIIDDGSKDNSREILLSYSSLDARIHLIFQENQGLSSALNNAIAVARTPLIARMDQDDLCHVNRLKLQFELMVQFTDVVAVGSSADFIDANGEGICTYVIEVDDYKLRQTFPNSPFVHPSVMFRKEIFFLAGQYPVHFKWGGEDVVLFSKLSRFGKLRNFSEPLISYRLVPGSMSRKPAEFRAILSSLIASEIAGIKVMPEQWEQLEMANSSINKAQAKADYHFEVAKLCLWSGANRKQTSYHLSQSFHHLNAIKVISMMVLICVPKSLLKLIYFKVKHRMFEKIK